MEFSQIALLLVGAAVGGVIAKVLRQPLLVGYIIAGFVMASLGLMPQGEILSSLGAIGVALLLFLVGLEINLDEISTIGKVALIIGICQVVATSIVGFLIATLLGFGTLPSIYLGLALTFSSTIVIIKLLSEKDDLGSLYGRISVGLLLVQDLVAIIILMFLAGLHGGEYSFQSYLFIIIKGALLLASVWVLSRKILPLFFKRIIDQSTELIFIVSIAWAIGVAAFVGGPLGFSPEIGGFLAGLAISSLPDHFQIATRTKPLRDFFLTIFFLLLGTNIILSQIGLVFIPIIIFSIFVLVGNPLIMLIIMGILGYKKRTSFLASVTVAQVSEFSLILMSMGLLLGHISSKEVSVVVFVGIVTMTLSTYLILRAEWLFKKLEKYLVFFERRNATDGKSNVVEPMTDHVVLIGSHRTGASIISILKKRKFKFLVVDFNPSLANSLMNKNIPVLFGDISDLDILEASNISEAKLVISTSPDIHDNLTILNYLRSQKAKSEIILKAHTINEAILLYKKGADYVVVPEIFVGEHIRQIIKSHGVSGRITKLGQSHLKRLYKAIKK